MTAARTSHRKAEATSRPLATGRPGNEIRSAPTEDLLTREQVAKRLQLAVGTLANWAAFKKGPPFIRLANGRVRYPSEAYFEWESAQAER